ncbi:hypothetical protein VST7929_01516 [Vibrio stylophorae]|uniref:Lipoprotein n=1 Tax=Vibrio stylophorae TaxID=659351 RepID=A0ABM8ZTJ8_9VIBR|nr:hypothetical protein [Vibrio stylophorae]CAH0533645.1 hypothetical protein VST7929_01516 [Vibrio stylophorae]
MRIFRLMAILVATLLTACATTSNPPIYASKNDIANWTLQQQQAYALGFEMVSDTSLQQDNANKRQEFLDSLTKSTSILAELKKAGFEPKDVALIKANWHAADQTVRMMSETATLELLESNAEQVATVSLTSYLAPAYLEAIDLSVEQGMPIVMLGMIDAGTGNASKLSAIESEAVQQSLNELDDSFFNQFVMSFMPYMAQFTQLTEAP